MRMPLSTLRELMEYHYSRRNRVYAFCAGLKPEDLARPLGAGWTSIQRTLLHCLEAEEYWVQHRLQGGERPNFEDAAFPDLASLQGLANEVRQRTEAFVATLTEDNLDDEGSATFSDGTVVNFTTGKVLMHVITHDTHHRGQVLLLARQTGYTPPDIDLI